MGTPVFPKEGGEGQGWAFIFSQKAQCETHLWTLHNLLCSTKRWVFVLHIPKLFGTVSPMISIQVQKRNWPQKSERRVNFSLKIRYRLSLQNAGGNFTSDGALISFPMDIQSFMKRILAVVSCDQCGLLLSRRAELRLPIWFNWEMLGELELFQGHEWPENLFDKTLKAEYGNYLFDGLIQ